MKNIFFIVILFLTFNLKAQVSTGININASIAVDTGETCASPHVITSLPFFYSGTTAGSVNNYDSTNSICHSAFMNGEDYVFSFTPSINQCIKIDLSTAESNPALFLYQDCPNSNGICLASSEFATGSGSIYSISLTAGHTYFIVVDNSIINGNLNIPFDINVTNSGAAPSNDDCVNATNLGNISQGITCTLQTFTTSCSTPTPIGEAGVPFCVPAHVPPYFIDGFTGDVWLRFIAGYTGALRIHTFQSSVNSTANAAMAVYTSVCGVMGIPYACDFSSGANGMPSLTITIINGNTYYIRVWTEHPESAGNFDICFDSDCPLINDFPCGSVFVPLDGITSGDNTCAAYLNEPSNSAQCIVGGIINTVWYKTVVPPSGSVRIKTHPLTLTDTQIQAFLFPSGCTNASTVNVPLACNDNGTGCSGGFFIYSEQFYGGLTPGDTLYFAVDGTGNLQGTFEISCIDGSSNTFPPVAQQDCERPEIVCSSNIITVPDPGFRNFGNVCDLPTGIGCFGVGERNSIWYQFVADPALSGGTATISFDILSHGITDLDFMLWDVTTNPDACQDIKSLFFQPTRCNFASADSATGLSPGGTINYSPSIVFTGAPRTYLLLLINYNSSVNAGFIIDWSTTPIPTILNCDSLIDVPHINKPGNEIIIYPNPCQDKISISSSYSIKDISIINLLGQTLSDFKISSNNSNYYEIDINNIPAGVYYVKINSSERQFVKVIIKQ